MPLGTSGAGSPPAGEVDWNAIRERCLSEARRVLRNPADAEEAAQEALLRAWKNRGAAIERPSAWLSTIARNEALRIAERRGRLVEYRADEIELCEGEAWEPAVVDSVFVEGLLAPLDLADQRLLRLRYLEDLTQPQIAQVLGMAEGTVKVRLHRLRRLLRERAGMYA